MEPIDFDLPAQEGATARLASAVRGEGRYIRAEHGRGAYGHLKILLSPHQGATAYRFEWQVPEGMLPANYMQAGALVGVKAALLEQLQGGAGVVGVCASVFDGSYHDTDSSEESVAIAAKLAVEDALRHATIIKS